MGAGSSININQFSEGCRLDEIVQKVKGLKSNSVSPTDTWVLDFKPNVYYDHNRLEKGFLKYFVDPYSMEAKQENIDLIYHSIGLRYEISVYRDVIKPLIEYQVCPNFISFLFAGISCKGITLLNSLLTTLPNNEAIYNLERNVEYITNNIRGRPSITEKVGKLVPLNKRIHPNIESNWKYSFMVNKVINPATTTTFIDFLTTNVKNTSISYLGYVLFDIFYACYSMYCAGVIHNDLHFGNIYLESLPSPVKVCYIYGEEKKKFVMERNYKIMIYDFDRAYAEVLGENKLLDLFCKKYTSCNKLSSNKDFYKIIQGMYTLTKTDVERETYLSLLTSDKSKMRELHEYFTDKQGNFYIYKGKPLQDVVFTRFNSGEMILDNLVNYLKKYHKSNFDDSDFTEKYTCRPSLFKNGKLLLSKDNEKLENRIEETEKLFKDLYDRCKDLRVEHNTLDQQVKLMTQRENEMKQKIRYYEQENERLRRRPQADERYLLVNE